MPLVCCSFQVGAKLVSFNLSQQTDSSDLLGGFKPVGAQEALLPLLNPFQTLVRATWTKGNNEDFILRVTKYAERRKWSHLLSGFKTALAKVGLQEEGGAWEGTAAAAAAAAAGDPTMANGVAAVEDEEAALQERQRSHGEASTSSAAAGSGGAGGKGGRRGKGSGAGRGRGTGQQEEEGKPSKRRKIGAVGVSKAGGEAVDPAVAVAATAAAGGAGDGGRNSSSSSKKLPALSPELLSKWKHFKTELSAAERAAAAAEGGFAFAFIEGQLVQALKQGWWLLLDEINLAPPEVLERIAGILEVPATAGQTGQLPGQTSQNEVDQGDGGGSSSSRSGLLLVERGDVTAVARHPGFRLVAAMNPATDAGKRDLPAALRARFTELWVSEPRQREDLVLLVGGYLAGAGPQPPVQAVVDMYMAAKQEAVSGVGSKGGSLHWGLSTPRGC